jgi:hypothetical protein
VLAAIFFDNRTQREVAEQLEVLQPRVSKLLAEALELLARAGLPLPTERPHHRLRYYDPSTLERIADR